MTMGRVVIKRGSDQVVTLVGLRTTDQPPVYLNTAAVQATLQDNRGHAVPPFDQVPMTYVPGSSGNYAWQIEAHTSMLSKGVEYSVVFTVVQGTFNYREVHVVSVVD
jgi:hypothetical protein